MKNSIDVYILQFKEGDAVRLYSLDLDKGVVFRTFDGLGGNSPPRYQPFEMGDRECMIEAIKKKGKVGDEQGIIKKIKIDKQEFESFVNTTKSEMAHWTLYELSLKDAVRLEERIRGLKPMTLK